MIKLLKKTLSWNFRFFLKSLPIRNNLWVYGSRFGEKFDDNSKYFFLYMQKNHPEIKSIWMTRNKRIYKYLKSKKLPVALEASWRGRIFLFMAEVAIVSVCHRDISFRNLTKRINVVQLWHGTPLKHNNIDDLKETYLFVSVAAKEFLTTQKLGPPNKHKFLLTGYPRNDVLLSNETYEPYNKNILNVIKGKKVILYLPTYREKSTGDFDNEYNPFEGIDIAVLQETLQKHNAIFIVKLHAVQHVNESICIVFRCLVPMIPAGNLPSNI